MVPFLLATIPTPLQPPSTAQAAAVSQPFEPVVATEAASASMLAMEPTTLAKQAPTPNPADNPQPKQFPYASIQAGVGFPNTLNGNFSLLGLTTTNSALNLNTGFNGELAVGYQFPDLRTDLSLGYSSFSSNTQTLTVPGFGSASVSGTGSVNLFTVMANAYYDFKIHNKNGTLSRWSPYVGAGIGWGSLSTPGCAGANCNAFNGGSGGGFAYQGKIGLSYLATNSGSLFLEGGYLGMTGTTVENVNYNSFGTWRLNLGWRQRL